MVLCMLNAQEIVPKNFLVHNAKKYQAAAIEWAKYVRPMFD